MRAFEVKLWRRAVGLIAAYVVALYGILAVFGAAELSARRAAAVFDPLAITCHGNPGAAPESGRTAALADCCGVCLSAVANGLPPAAVALHVLLHADGVIKPAAAPAVSGFNPSDEKKSRAPPTA